MPRVYRINFDHGYRDISLEDESLWNTPAMIFDGKVKSSPWIVPHLYVPHPLRDEPDFWYLTPGLLVISRRVLEIRVMRRFMAESAEQLPLACQGQDLIGLNIIECINCLDPDKCTWLCTPAGVRNYLKLSFGNSRGPS
jgi:hypothetical protein